MGVGTISRICCRPRFFARFQFGDRTRRSVRRRQAEAREELTSPVCRYKDANPSGPRIDQGHVKGICVLSRYRPTTVLIYEKWHGGDSLPSFPVQKIATVQSSVQKFPLLGADDGALRALVIATHWSCLRWETLQIPSNNVLCEFILKSFVVYSLAHYSSQRMYIRVLP